MKLPNMDVPNVKRFGVNAINWGVKLVDRASDRGHSSHVVCALIN